MKFRRWLPFFVVLIPAVLILLWYIQRSYVNTVYLDAFMNVPSIDHYFHGNLTLDDLFPTGLQHLLPGYAIIAILNAHFFALDMRLDPILFLVSSVVIAAIIYAECLKVFNRVHSIALGIIFVPLAFLCFSLVAPPIMNMATQFMCGSAIALLIGWLLQRDFDKSAQGLSGSRWSLIGIFILIPIYFVFFASGYFPGLVVGLFAMYIFHSLITGKWLEKRMLLIGIEVFMGIVFFFSYVIFRQSGQGGETLRELTQYLTDPINNMLFYIAGIGGSLTSAFTMTPSIILILGGIMAVISLVAVWLFFSSGMYHKTYLPIYCMAYTLGAITAIRIGRGMNSDYGWITNEWYGFHLRFFVIGVVWILLYVLFDIFTSTKQEESV